MSEKKHSIYGRELWFTTDHFSPEDVKRGVNEGNGAVNRPFSYVYESFGAFIRDCATCEPLGSGSYCSHARTSAEVFKRVEDGTCTQKELDTALELASRCMSEMEAAGKLGVNNKRRKMVMAAEGEEPDIGRYLSKDENHWIKPVVGRGSPVVRLGINLSVAGHNGDDKFSMAAGYCAAAAEALERLGYAVEIVAGDYAARNGLWYAYSGLLKSSTEPLDLPRILSVGCRGVLSDFIFRPYMRDYGFHGGNMHALTPEKETYHAFGIDYMFSYTYNQDAIDDCLSHIGSKFA